MPAYGIHVQIAVFGWERRSEPISERREAGDAIGSGSDSPVGIDQDFVRKTSHVHSHLRQIQGDFVLPQIPIERRVLYH